MLSEIIKAGGIVVIIVGIITLVVIFSSLRSTVPLLIKIPCEHVVAFVVASNIAGMYDAADFNIVRLVDGTELKTKVPTLTIAMYLAGEIDSEAYHEACKERVHEQAA